MPRKSAADLSIVRPRVDGRSNRLHPPRDLTAAQRKVFLSIVGTVDTEHFRPSDLPLVRQYVEAVAMTENAAAELARTGGPIDAATGAQNPWFSIWVRATRTMSTLSTRLRLAPHSRAHPRSVARANHGGVSAYQLMELEDEHGPLS